MTDDVSVMREQMVLSVSAVKEAMARAGKLLSIRPRTEHEIRTRLAAAGFEEETIERTTARLEELHLLDDLAFARQWIEERVSRKGLGPETLRVELEAKGIASEVVDQALADGVGDEELRAREVAAAYLSKLAAQPLAEQARKLAAMLARKGYSEEVVETAVRAVLPPEGWD